MITATLGKQYYALVGKLLFMTQPDVAHELVSSYLPHTPPLETDLTRIRHFYRLFCELTETPVTRTDAVMHRRLFIAAMLHLYSPSAFGPHGHLSLRWGLATALGEVLGQTKNLISIRIREVITWEKNYDEFRTAVDGIVQRLKGGGAS